MKFTSVCKIVFLSLISISLTNGYLLYGETCDPAQVGNPDLECDLSNGLTCRGNICDCLNPDDMILNPAQGSCVTLVGGNCVLNLNATATKQSESIFLPCTLGASCQFNDTGYDYECMCKSSNAESPDRRCFSTSEEKCVENSDCFPNQRLVCTHGFCQCPNPLDQDFKYGSVENSTCYILVGAPCDPTGDEGQVQCEKDRGVCAQDLNSPTGFSCACDKSNGWISNFKRTCQRGYLGACEVGNPDYIYESYGECSTDAGLMCSQGKCMCQFEPDQIWDEEQQLCGSLEGKKCTLMDDGGNLICRTGLNCVPFIGPFDGICRKTTEVTTESTTTVDSGSESTANSSLDPPTSTENTSLDPLTSTDISSSDTTSDLCTSTTENTSNGNKVTLHFHSIIFSTFVFSLHFCISK